MAARSSTLAAEYPEADYAGHQVALEHKHSVLARFKELAEEAGRKAGGIGECAVLVDGWRLCRRAHVWRFYRQPGQISGCHSLPNDRSQLLKE